MTQNCLIRKCAIMAMVLLAAQTLTAQTWTQTGAASNYWYCIASSADGSRLIAGAFPGLVYLSTNSGTTWMPTMTSTTDSWCSVASSADGTKLMAISGDNGIFISTNSGATWISTNWSDSYWWGSGASSADGKTLAATVLSTTNFNFGFIYCSTNSGVTWNSNKISYISGVAMSADGTKMVAAGTPYLWRSTNSGITWMQATGAPVIYYPMVSPSQYIASSADGNKLVYCIPPGEGNAGEIYVSTDCGNSWNLTSAPNEPWLAVASSADGNTLLAVPNDFTSPYPIYLSTNSGTSWTTNGSSYEIWEAVASSADGGKLFAGAWGDNLADPNSGTIYISQSVRSPSINIAPRNGNVKLSWFVPSTNFVLQQSTNLYSWTDVTNAPVPSANNLNNEVSLSGTNKVGFYRLKTP